MLRPIWYFWILAFHPNLDEIVTGLRLGLHPLQVGWWIGGHEHEHLLVSPGDEFLHMSKPQILEALLCPVVGQQFLLSGVIFSFSVCFIDVLVMLLGEAHAFVWR